MENFIARQNIEHFQRLIEHEPDLVQRQRLMQMLAEERAKLNGCKTDSPQGKSQPYASDGPNQASPE